MATTTVTSAETTAADCGEPAAKVETKSPTTQLCVFAAPMKPHEAFERTASYARDPQRYLLNKLGPGAFDKRKHLLSIPDVIDKDSYGEGAHKRHFEQHIAQLLGKDHGLFFLTGVQAQLAALRIHCDRSGRDRVAWHATSHLEWAEERSSETLYQLERTFLGNDPAELPSLEDIKKVLSLPGDQRPAAILLEIPNRVLGCQTYSFSELEAISAVCRKADVKLHCDGARIWEIEPYYQATASKTFADIGALFDSLYLSLYKGLGGATGAVLISNDAHFISEAKKWQRRAGGNSFTMMYEVTDCERGFNENIGTFASKWVKMAEVVERVSQATDKFRTSDDQRVINFIPNKPTYYQIRTSFEGYTASELYAARDKAQEKTHVRVFERF